MELNTKYIQRKKCCTHDGETSTKLRVERKKEKKLNKIWMWIVLINDGLNLNGGIRVKKKSFLMWKAY